MNLLVPRSLDAALLFGFALVLGIDGVADNRTRDIFQEKLLRARVSISLRIEALVQDSTHPHTYTHPASLGQRWPVRLRSFASPFTVVMVKPRGCIGTNFCDKSLRTEKSLLGSRERTNETVKCKRYFSHF